MASTAHGIMFHHFHGPGHPAGQGSIDAGTLRAMIAHLGRERILPAREWLAQAEAGRLPPDSLCLTFDDNLRCQHDVALPVLRELGLTAFWFVASASLDSNGPHLEVFRAFRDRCFRDVSVFYEAFDGMLRRLHLWYGVEIALSDFRASHYLAEYSFYTPADRRFRFIRDEVLGPQRYEAVMKELMKRQGVCPDELARDLWMTPAQLRTLRVEGHVIGLHSHSHPTRLAKMSGRRQMREYVNNYRRLWAETGERPRTASHPCNSYNVTTLRVLKRLGVSIAFRANMELTNATPLELPRRDHTDVLREMTSCASPSSPATSLATSR